jgi:hypothetical protein
LYVQFGSLIEASSLRWTLFTVTPIGTALAVVAKAIKSAVRILPQLCSFMAVFLIRYEVEKMDLENTIMSI